MGALLAKFRKEKTTTVILEGLEEKIKQIEGYSLNTQEQKKRFVSNFLGISIGVYVIAFILFYFFYFPPTWNERLIYLVPLALFPLVINLLRKLFTWYFQRKLNKNSNKLDALRAEKKRILEQVMDKETYKVAVNLLDRFDEKSRSRVSFGMISNASRSSSNTTLNRSINSNLSTRQSSSTLSTTPLKSTNAAYTSVYRSMAATPRTLAITPSTLHNTTGQELRRRTPFPIVNSQNRGVLDRIIDVLVGDGPQDRFAMICKECFGHNGMAPKDEFDYATFRCAFCNVLNPARKARPVAPRLSVQSSTPPKKSDNSSESSNDDDESDKEEEGATVEQPSLSDNIITVTKTTDKPDCDPTVADHVDVENVEEVKKPIVTSDPKDNDDECKEK